jgi:hypothetical protein
LQLIEPGIMFALLCCVNCALIEIWEWRDAGHQPGIHPHPCTLWLSRSLKPLVAAMTVICCVEIGRSLFAALLLSGLCILVLDSAKGRLRADARRVLADAALLTPLLFLHG